MIKRQILTCFYRIIIKIHWPINTLYLKFRGLTILKISTRKWCMCLWDTCVMGFKLFREIWRISFFIRSCMSSICNVLLIYNRFFTWPHRNKPCGVKLEDLAGHLIVLLRPISPPRNVLSKYSRTWELKCSGALSCWIQMVWLAFYLMVCKSAIASVYKQHSNVSFVLALIFFVVL